MGKGEKKTNGHQHSSLSACWLRMQCDLLPHTPASCLQNDGLSSGQQVNLCLSPEAIDFFFSFPLLIVWLKQCIYLAWSFLHSYFFFSSWGSKFFSTSANNHEGTVQGSSHTQIKAVTLQVIYTLRLSDAYVIANEPARASAALKVRAQIRAESFLALNLVAVVPVWCLARGGRGQVEYPRPCKVLLKSQKSIRITKGNLKKYS